MIVFIVSHTSETQQPVTGAHKGTGEAHQLVTGAHQGTGKTHQSVTGAHRGTSETHQPVTGAHQGTGEFCQLQSLNLVTLPLRNFFKFLQDSCFL